MATQIKFKNGTDTALVSTTLGLAEPGVVTNQSTPLFYLGDGITPGGFLIGGLIQRGLGYFGGSNITDGSMILGSGAIDIQTSRFTPLAGNGYATGTQSICVGSNNLASSDFCISIGTFNFNSGLNSLSLGNSNIATFNAIFGACMGYNNVIYLPSSIAIGKGNISSGSSALSIGDTNKAYGFRSSAIGYQNQSTGANSSSFGISNNAGSSAGTAIGFTNVTISGSNNLAIGSQNTVSGASSAAIGAQNLAGGNHAVAIGYQANALNESSFAIGAAGGISSRGGNQFVINQFAGTTTDNSSTEIYLGAVAGKKLTISPSHAFSCELEIIGIQSNFSANAFAGRRWVSIRRDASNNTSLIGSPQVLGTDQNAGLGSSWGVSLAADDTNEALTVTVTGSAATTVKWKATVKTHELG